ncbi:MAG: metallophosphoesterase [Candidatus Thorarchaeota archaeon]|nr:MAG: metallophosphoesterase [Candidatus Thorarchaeota archaeon]
MRIAAVSDIHVRPDGSDEDLISGIHDRAVELSPDVFVIAGDISDMLSTLSETLSKLRIPSIPNLFVPGNHDVWFEEDQGIGSLDKYSKGIGETCKENGFVYLPDEPHLSGNLAFVGSLGWSDYSFRREELSIPEEAYEQKQFRGAVWNDFFNIDWTWSDKEAAALFNQKLEYDLGALTDDVRHVVYVSHHLPFKELTLYKDKLPWDFFSAYMGSVETGRILKDDGRVILTISGHSHIRNVVSIEGITAITVPIGYGRPPDKDMSELADKSVAGIEINSGSVKLTEFVEGDICADMPYVF